MSLSKKIKKLLTGYDEDNLVFLEPLLHNIKVTKSCKLLAKSKCKILLAENATLFIEEAFEGIIIGRKNSEVNLRSKFSGIICCDKLHFRQSTTFDGTIFAKQFTIVEGIIFNGEHTGIVDNIDMMPFKFSDLENITEDQLKNQYIEYLNNQQTCS